MNDFNLDEESYCIEPELKVGRIFTERNVDVFTFKKNEDIYDYDLEVYNDTEVMGYVEVEHTKSWTDYFIPRNWYCYSILTRKISEEALRRRDTSTLFYVKFNEPFTNCFCVSFVDAWTFGMKSRRDGHNSNIIDIKYDRYTELPLSADYVVTGIDRSLHYILTNLLKGRRT